MFPEETASYKFVHTEQKKSLVHARNYHKISCHTPSQPVENSPLCMNKNSDNILVSSTQKPSFITKN